MNGIFSRRRKQSDGYSTVELVIVAGIVGLTALLALFDYGATARPSRVERAALQMVADFRMVRMRAIGENTTASISLNPDTGTYTCWVDSNTNGYVETSETWLRAIGDVGALALSANVSFGRFTPLGQFTCAGSFLSVHVHCPGGGTQTVYVLRGGEVGLTDEAI